MMIPMSFPTAALLLFCIIDVSESLPATYDQRQDGELNVRADLQNVIIVAVVPKTDVTSNLLEYVLTKSGVSPQQRRRAIAKRHRNKAAAEPVSEDDLQDPETEIQDRMDVRMPEVFVEPKTPYKVDISEAKKHYQKLHKNDQKTRSSGLGKSSLHRHNSQEEEIEDDTPVPVVIPVENNRYVQTESADRAGNNIRVVGLGAEFPKDLESKKNIPEHHKNKVTTDGDEKEEDNTLKLIGATEQCAPDQSRDEEGICQLVQKDVDIIPTKNKT